MRFMMLLKSDATAEAGVMPDEALLVAMGKYNQELVKAGALITGDGLQPSSKGARIRFAGGKPTVIDGPFPETNQLIAGYWMIEVASKEEAIEWASRVPFSVEGPSAMSGGNGEIEIRQVFEAEDFAAEGFESDEARAVLEAEQRHGKGMSG